MTPEVGGGKVKKRGGGPSEERRGAVKTDGVGEYNVCNKSCSKMSDVLTSECNYVTGWICGLTPTART